MTYICPEGMYPMDSDYENEVEDLDELIKQAEAGSDTLNFPIGWSLQNGKDEPRFEVIFLMPRKYGKTWSLYTTKFDQGYAEMWVKAFTHREASAWFGWGDN